MESSQNKTKTNRSKGKEVPESELPVITLERKRNPPIRWISHRVRPPKQKCWRLHPEEQIPHLWRKPATVHPPTLLNPSYSREVVELLAQRVDQLAESGNQKAQAMVASRRPPLPPPPPRIPSTRERVSGSTSGKRRAQQLRSFNKPLTTSRNSRVRRMRSVRRSEQRAMDLEAIDATTAGGPDTWHDNVRLRRALSPMDLEARAPTPPCSPVPMELQRGRGRRERW